ncbi:MAG: putative ABC transporter permease [Bacillota bacterium]|nr:putative ABC transporter permease [Bacillota bacterium]
MNLFLIFAFLFFIGSTLGWFIELVFRRFFSNAKLEHKWVNPGFLAGPYLPIYGFGLCTLYILAGIEKYSVFSSNIINKIILFAIMAICMTAIEYIAGIIFIKGMNVKLWDYSNEWCNIQGIICPLFSFFWAVLGALYYFLVHPHILTALRWLSENLAFSFVVGFFFGIFTIDLCYSANILVKIKKFAKDNKIIIIYEELKQHIRGSREKHREKTRFVLTMRSETPLTEHLKLYYKKQLELAEKIKSEINKKFS